MFRRTFFVLIVFYVGRGWTQTDIPPANDEGQTDATITWCTFKGPELTKCKDISKAIGAFSLNWSNVTLDCLHRETVGECLWDISQGTATVMTVCNGKSYTAGEQYGLIPLLAEKYRTEPEGVSNIDFASVAVIRKNDTRINSLRDLRGLKSCHSFLGWHSGWNVPISLLIEKQVLTGDDCLDNIDNVANFFSQSCAPRRNHTPFNIASSDKLCELCAGKGSARCTADDPYADDAGAFRCLKDGPGDVAFVRHDTVNGSDKDNFELLCPDGTKMPIDDYRQCNWGIVPTYTMMTSPKVGRYQRYVHKKFFQELLNVAGHQLLFNSSRYGEPDLLYGDRTVDLYDPKSVYFTDFMDATFVRTYKNQTLRCGADVPLRMRWCVTSDAENAKCNQMKLGFDSNFIKPGVDCVRGDSAAHCVRLIKNDEADIITLDSGDLYATGRTNDIIPIMFEDYGKGSAKYWAVAVAKASDPTVVFSSLKGRNSCHTGVGRTAGWKVPVDTLLSSKQIEFDYPCGALEAIGEFFNRSCAPGALDKTYIPHNGQTSENLCQLCRGEGESKCARSDAEPFYGYTGAFRCLVEGGGDVAFVNHLTALENTDGNNDDDWARGLKSSDFVLLCRDGTRQTVDKYQECNLAQVPTHTVVVSSNRTEKDIQTYIRALNKAQIAFGDDVNPNFRLYSSPAGAKDLIFRDATKQLLPVPENLRTMETWLDGYLPTVETSKNCA